MLNMKINGSFKENIITFIQQKKVFISVITVLYFIPLLLTAQFTSDPPIRSLLNDVTFVLIFGIFTLSFELQLGRTGLLNFGQAVFFGVGAYAFYFYLTFIYSINGTMPFPLDIIITLFQNPIISFIIAIIFGILFGALLGFGMGLTTNRMRGTTFAFIALAIAMVFYTYASQTVQGVNLFEGGSGKQVCVTTSCHGLDLFTSTWTYLGFCLIVCPIIFILFLILIYQDLKARRSFFGISLFKDPLEEFSNESTTNLSFFQKNRNKIKGILFIIVLIVFSIILLIIVLPNIFGMISVTENNFFVRSPINYYLVLTFSIIVYILMELIIHSPFGRALAAISQNEQRAQALGINVYWDKVKSLSISGGIAGLSGALYASTIKLLTPDTTFSVNNTINVMIFSIVGGLNTLFGSFIGAGFVISSENGSDSILGILSQILDKFNISSNLNIVFIGLVYILIVIFLPFGVVGTLQVKKFKILESLQRFRINTNDYWLLAFLLTIFTSCFILYFQPLLNLLFK